MEKAENIVGEHSMPCCILIFSLRSCDVFAVAAGAYGHHHGNHRCYFFVDLLVCFGYEALAARAVAISYVGATFNNLFAPCTCWCSCCCTTVRVVWFCSCCCCKLLLVLDTCCWFSPTGTGAGFVGALLSSDQHPRSFLYTG